jgi:hypothetical protein
LEKAIELMNAAVEMEKGNPEPKPKKAAASVAK